MMEPGYTFLGCTQESHDDKGRPLVTIGLWIPGFWLWERIVHDSRCLKQGSQVYIAGEFSWVELSFGL